MPREDPEGCGRCGSAPRTSYGSVHMGSIRAFAKPRSFHVLWLALLVLTDSSAAEGFLPVRTRPFLCGQLPPCLAHDVGM